MRCPHYLVLIFSVWVIWYGYFGIYLNECQRIVKTPHAAECPTPFPVGIVALDFVWSAIDKTCCVEHDGERTLCTKPKQIPGITYDVTNRNHQQVDSSMLIIPFLFSIITAISLELSLLGDAATGILSVALFAVITQILQLLTLC